MRRRRRWRWRWRTNYKKRLPTCVPAKKDVVRRAVRTSVISHANNPSPWPLCLWWLRVMWHRSVGSEPQCPTRRSTNSHNPADHSDDAFRSSEIGTLLRKLPATFWMHSWLGYDIPPNWFRRFKSWWRQVDGLIFRIFLGIVMDFQRVFRILKGFSKDSLGFSLIFQDFLRIFMVFKENSRWFLKEFWFWKRIFWNFRWFLKNIFWILIDFQRVLGFLGFLKEFWGFFQDFYGF